MKEELKFSHTISANCKETKSGASFNSSIEPTIGIRPRPLICKPGRVNVSNCKSEPIETKRHWAPGAWQDATRTSAFQPYKVCS
jgi:hypothetical protein